MKKNLKLAILGGMAGTAAMTMMMYFVAPMMLGKPMDIAAMLGGMMGGSWILGMLVHLMNGIVVFPLFYSLVVCRFLDGSPWLRGMMWGFALWLVAQVAVMPMTGAGLFSAKMGGMMAVMASLMGHAVYGVLLGAIAGPQSPEASR